MAAQHVWNIGFDARLAGPRHAGIGRYSEELLKRLLKLSTSKQAPYTTHWYVFVSPDHELSWLSKWEAKGMVTVVQTTVRHYSLAEQTTWWRQLQQYDLDLFHVPHFNAPVLYRGTLLITIHDLLWHQERDAQATTLPASIHWLKHAAYQFVSGQAIRHARLVFVPTKWVAKDVQRVTGRVENVVVTPEGLPSAFSSASAVHKRRISEPYIVYTGSLYPHKNLSVVFKALRQLPQLRLKVIGARSVFLERTRLQAERMGVAGQIEWCGRLSDEDVLEQYHGAVALIQPSRAEGFGLTGLEAMAAGCPVIVSDIPVFREVYQEHATYFPSYDGVSLAHAIEKAMMSQPTAAERLVLQNFAKQYSWDTTAQLTWKGYEAVLQSLPKRAAKKL